eukprot:1333464-Amorphochlora_amoeboformis.AAC.1
MYAYTQLARATSRRNWTLLDSGLFAKWAPSPEGMHDKMTPIVDAIVERLFPQELYRIPNPEGTYEDYLKRMRYRYKTKVLSPLRRYAEVRWVGDVEVGWVVSFVFAYELYAYAQIQKI